MIIIIMSYKCECVNLELMYFTCRNIKLQCVETTIKINDTNLRSMQNFDQHTNNLFNQLVLYMKKSQGYSHT